MWDHRPGLEHRGQLFSGHPQDVVVPAIREARSCEGGVQPKLEAKPLGLPHTLLFEDHWARLPDSDRQSLYILAERLKEKRLAELKSAAQVSSAVKDALNTSQPIQEAIHRIVSMRMTQAVPPPFASITRVNAAVAKHFDGAPSEVLSRLDCPFPDQLLEQALFEEYNEHPKRPPEAILKEIESRERSIKNVGLRWMLRRWRGKDSDLQMIEDQLTSSRQPEPWLVDWVLRSLPDRDWISQLNRSMPLSETDVSNARLYLACSPDPQNPNWVKGKLEFTINHDVDRFPAVFHAQQISPDLAEWVFQKLALSMANGWIPGWTDNGLSRGVGIFYGPVEGRERSLLKALNDCSRIAPAYLPDRLSERLFRNLTPFEVLDKTPENRRATIESRLGDDELLMKPFKKLLAAGPSDRKSTTESLMKALRSSNDEGFCCVANSLLDKGDGEWRMTLENSRDGYDEFIFVGLKFRTTDPRFTNLNELFAAVASSLVPEVSFDKELPTRSMLDQRENRRFSWLMSRMGHNMTTKYLQISK